MRRPAVQSGVEGVWNVLRELGVVDEPVESTSDQRVLSDDVPRVVAEMSGLFELRADLAVGDAVDADEELGAVFDPSSFERLETVTASGAGILYSVSRGGVVVTGERVASIAADS
ncbi:succinylglutamate desuccinylase/aspartoacylase family protein [Halobellus rufus]|uniref:succinylglutamate desuccinylase/aspartoacylase family protein n=1 Tax=Halobellus rufus TaxID=1448860 RepID=UPI00373FD493